MDGHNFDSDAWNGALTLVERAAGMQERRVEELSAGASPRGAERLERWRAQRPFNQDGYFARRLAADGLDENALLYLLSGSVRAAEAGGPVSPDWAERLHDAYSQPVTHSPLPDLEKATGSSNPGFAEAVRPLVESGHDRLRQAAVELAKARACVPFDTCTVASALLPNLLSRLHQVLARTMALELNVARLEGRLQGDTPEARFQSFLESLRAPECALGLLEQYPVLARQLVAGVDRWVAAGRELLGRLCDDWDAICAGFAPERDPGLLVAVSSAGDTHRGGRSVCVLRFSSGFQLVYKPRSMAVDAHFQELLDWLNARGAVPPLRSIRILERGTYGWEEFVAPQPCASGDEVQRFYERQGAYLALLYLLSATDFHFENLVAAGEHPVLLDLEALFHPSLAVSGTDRAQDAARRKLMGSVLALGLLPMRLWANAGSDGVDISGLGAVEGQLTPHGVAAWAGAGTDEMRFVRRRTAMRGGANRPTLAGAAVDMLEYREAIVLGFTRMYGLLCEQRHALLADGGPLARFAEDETRVIVRATQTYGRLLAESYHPDMLRDALERDRLFDRLWQAVEYEPRLASIVRFEQQDLRSGDIPIFFARPGSRALWTSAGETVPGYLPEPGLAQVRARLRAMCAADLEQQTWFVRASLATLYTGMQTKPRAESAVSAQAPDRHQLIKVAREIGDRLAARAFLGAEDVGWIGLDFTNERRPQVTTLGPDLYDGLPGIALFLGYLGAITGEERYRKLAEMALKAAREQAAADPAAITSVGCFTGWGGLIYALAHLGSLYRAPALLHEALEMASRLPDLADKDEQYDIIGGSAGCIAALLALYECVPSPALLCAATRCGDRLLAQAVPMEDGIGWVIAGVAERPLTGFSHGAAGIAWALLELAAATGQERFRRAGLEAIAYERSTFRAAEGNWPDYRANTGPEDGDPPVGNRRGKAEVAWCHGAPGIGLARLRSLRHVDDAAMRGEIEIAVQTTLRRGFGLNHSLCHGGMGNLELLLEASRVLVDAELSSEVMRIAGAMLGSAAAHGWLCGVPLAVEVPGLMTGLAGIGYECLRLADPDRVPSVLALDPPLR